MALRDAVRTLRNDFTRAQTQAAENLSAYLTLVEKRLGHFGVLLSASIADADLTEMLVDGSGQIASYVGRIYAPVIDLRLLQQQGEVVPRSRRRPVGSAVRGGSGARRHQLDEQRRHRLETAALP